MKKAIITGANGMMANALINKLNLQKIPTIAYGYKPFEREINCKKKIIDLLSPDSLIDDLDADTTIFHLAARVNVGLSSKDPRGDMINNFLPTFEILELARKTGAKVIFPSTASVFFPKENNNKYSEMDFVRASSPYGASKLASEEYCFAYHRCFGMDIKIARYFSVYGPDMDKFVIFDLIKKIQKNPKELLIKGDGKQVRDYLYIDDAIDALILIAENGTPGEDYNVGSGKPTTIINLAQLIANEMGVPNIKIKTTNEFRVGDTEWFADNSKLSSLGFIPKVSLNKGIRKTVESITTKK
jgi:UDP-glucose 4-epimerase